jgi:hypothetical protein
VQEIFQDACQTYYGTYGPPAPMVLFESAYWDRDGVAAPDPRAKPVWPLLRQLAGERVREGFPDVILLTDSITETLDHIARNAPA